MIIDLILDRKDGKKYNKNVFFKEVIEYTKNGDFYDIINAFAMGTEKEVKKALKSYIIRNDYNLKINNYISKTKWL